MASDMGDGAVPSIRVWGWTPEALRILGWLLHRAAGAGGVGHEGGMSVVLVPAGRARRRRFLAELLRALGGGAALPAAPEAMAPPAGAANPNRPSQADMDYFSTTPDALGALV